MPMQCFSEVLTVYTASSRGSSSHGMSKSRACWLSIRLIQKLLDAWESCRNDKL